MSQENPVRQGGPDLSGGLIVKSLLQKIFKVVEYGNLQEEPFVFIRTKAQPQAWNRDRPDAFGNSFRCVVDELLAARAEARSISFPLAECGCLTGRLLNNHYRKFRDDEYLTFKPFSMVTAHEIPELFVLFGQRREIRTLIKAIKDVEYELKVPAEPLSSANCRLLALPFGCLTGGLDQILICTLRSDLASPPENVLMALLPMPIVIKIADALSAPPDQLGVKEKKPHWTEGPPGIYY